MDVKSLVSKIKREIPEDVIFQDREYYSQPLQVFRETFDSRKRQLDLGKLANNIDRIVENDPRNETKIRAVYRYFMVLLDSEKHHLDYRAFRSDILSRYKDLIGYI